MGDSSDDYQGLPPIEIPWWIIALGVVAVFALSGLVYLVIGGG